MTTKLRGLAALAGLAAIIAGMPALLIASAGIGTLSITPTPAGIWAALTSPDNGTIALTLFRGVGWAAWAVLTIAVAVELVALIRHARAPRLRGLGIPQMFAHQLVAAAAVVFVATSSLTATGLVDPQPAHAAGAAPAHAPDAAPHQARPLEQPATPRLYTVKKGDTLSEIALEQTGHASNYPKLFHASGRIIQPDGHPPTDPDLIYPGGKIAIPTTLDIRAAHRPDHHRDNPRAGGTPPAPGSTATATSAATGTAAPASTTPTRAATATTPAATAVPGASHASAADPGQAGHDADVTPAWVLSGLAGSGALLAGALWVALARRRADQFRRRRPGRTITVPPPHLAPVEKTLLLEGRPTGSLVLLIDEILRRTVATLTHIGHPIPVLVGLDAHPDHLTLHLRTATDLAAPWTCLDPDTRQIWQTKTDGDHEDIGPLHDDSAPPWPQLVTVGRDEHGFRLLNLEALGVATLTGNPDYSHDLARYIVTELAVAPWARDVDIDCLHACDELPGLASDRIRHHSDPAVIDTTIATAVNTIDRLDTTDASSLETARVTYADDELWTSHLFISSTGDAEHLPMLTGLITAQTGRTGTAVLLMINPDDTVVGTELQLTDTGRLRVPSLDLDLVVTGVTHHEALGCVALMTAGRADNDTDLPTPEPDDRREWAQFCDNAGAMRAEFTQARNSAGDSAGSVLPEPDQVYVDDTANTEQDLGTLAPQVSVAVRDQVEAADPDLEADLARWWADTCERPRLQLLGPIKVRLGTTGVPTAAASRIPMCNEIVAYLSTRTDGATTVQLADAFGISEDRVRKDLTIVRSWLGKNPATGRDFLPGATQSSQAAERGVGLYLIEDLLTDADLFRRLRVRGESRGPDGMDDLRHALRLVNGTPFDPLRNRGGLWLADNPLDQHLLCAIVDVAHIVTSSALEAGDLQQAQAAAELAALVAPLEDTPQLDLAKIAERAGDTARAAGIARGVVTRRAGHSDGPLDLGQRSDAIMRTHRWLERAGRVS
ncbi:MAG: LysM peptidoglycan-binding domain-containing protein [Propionibacteriaceae bacterium]|nr:LysM peptidoglycan-binding domain-containing protein [Propionibacteriaceae bacterium]